MNAETTQRVIDSSFAIIEEWLAGPVWQGESHTIIQLSEALQKYDPKRYRQAVLSSRQVNQQTHEPA